ncbi:nitroreductase [Simplicispira lacusdiani]|uniref:nitroreductase n=1 Tax=Simplicispira lacusdiani TaxID=2213010 RepID=UPI000E73C6DE|nr:nitroreductase [Simplicispira lacusdiani]
MDVSEAVQRRSSIRAFKPDVPPAAMVRAILEGAARAPSGGNLQPWHVHALAGEPLTRLLRAVEDAPLQEAPEYAVYPPDLWEPYRTRRFRNAEQLYASIGIPREDKAARLRQMAKNASFFGAPVGIFLSVDRRMGPPQWADLGIYLQTVMLLAVEQGLDTCPQEFWAFRSQPVARFLDLPPERMLFAGIALGWRDENTPINQWRTERDPFETWAEMRGF